MHWPKQYWLSEKLWQDSKSEVRHRIKSVRKQLKIQQPLLPMQTDTNIWKYNTHLMQGRSGTSLSGSLHINNFSWKSKQCWKIHSSVKNICYTREKYIFRLTLKAPHVKSWWTRVNYCCCSLFVYLQQTELLSMRQCSVNIRAEVIECRSICRRV